MSFYTRPQCRLLPAATTPLYALRVVLPLFHQFPQHSFRLGRNFHFPGLLPPSQPPMPPITGFEHPPAMISDGVDLGITLVVTRLKGLG